MAQKTNKVVVPLKRERAEYIVAFGTVAYAIFCIVLLLWLNGTI